MTLFTWKTPWITSIRWLSLKINYLQCNSRLPNLAINVKAAAEACVENFLNLEENPSQQYQGAKI